MKHYKNKAWRREIQRRKFYSRVKSFFDRYKINVFYAKMTEKEYNELIERFPNSYSGLFRKRNVNGKLLVAVEAKTWKDMINGQSWMKTLKTTPSDHKKTKWELWYRRLRNKKRRIDGKKEIDDEINQSIIDN